ALELSDKIKRPTVPKECEHNGHMYYIKVNSLEERQKLILFLKKKGIHTVFHYIPLHSSVAGMKFSRFNGEDVYTTVESEKLLRLPLYYELKEGEIIYIIKCIYEFYNIETKH
ncbi:MAG: DegT/DnrJ/EryC1/StrS family aminotransferase, partial [Cellulosilyticum sp.]|nr:DegT/DnrJ/EryC1/StrS family aminotransferase [Cellulosilyticum sp.]